MASRSTLLPGAGPPVLRPVRSGDAATVWDLLAPVADQLIGMSSLPHSAEAATESCLASGATLADLAAGSFAVEPDRSRRLLFAIELTDDEGTAHSVGLTGVTFKHRYPNLAVEVATSADGQGLVMASSSAPWTRTELDSTFIAPGQRGQGLGSLVSRGRFSFLHLVGSQIPGVVASHLRGRFDADGSAPFWRCFGANLAPWPTSTEAEQALSRDPHLLDTLADHRRPLTAEVLESLGPVNADSLPAFHLLGAEGLSPNGMYDPIDGGPTVVAELAETVSGRQRVHGRAKVGRPGPIDALVSVAGVDRFRVTRAGIEVGESTIRIDQASAEALRIEPDALLAAVPLDGTRPDPDRENGRS